MAVNHAHPLQTNTKSNSFEFLSPVVCDFVTILHLTESREFFAGGEGRGIGVTCSTSFPNSINLSS